MYTSDGEEIKTTMLHPFYVKNAKSGDEEYGIWKASANLVAGDELLTEDGRIVYVKEVKVERLEESIKVYNLEVEGLHTYYVGSGVLVHNQYAKNNQNSEETNENEKLDDDALVVRGGTCTADKFSNGSGVTTDNNGHLNGVSVNSQNGLSVEELSDGIPNGKIGVTTVGTIRLNGGDVIPSPSKNKPMHATLFGISAEQAELIFNPVIPNPSKDN